MAQKPAFETLEVYQLADRLAAGVWPLVMAWSHFARDTIGKQMVRAVDSIGANLAEGYGRGSYADNKRFVHIARGSLNESICLIRRAAARGLFTIEQVTPLLAITDELGPRLNKYLEYINMQLKKKATPGKPLPPKG